MACGIVVVEVILYPTLHRWPFYRNWRFLPLLFLIFFRGTKKPVCEQTIVFTIYNQWYNMMIDSLKLRKIKSLTLDKLLIWIDFKTEHIHVFLDKYYPVNTTMYIARAQVIDQNTVWSFHQWLEYSETGEEYWSPTFETLKLKKRL